MENSKQITLEENIKEVEKSGKEFNRILSAHIGAAIEMESNFKLYSYRIIDPETFIERNKFLLQSISK